jgi:hypothetical protein
MSAIEVSNIELLYEIDHHMLCIILLGGGSFYRDLNVTINYLEKRLHAPSFFAADKVLISCVL